jgi:hypothetical protein
MDAQVNAKIRGVQRFMSLSLPFDNVSAAIEFAGATRLLQAGCANVDASPQCERGAHWTAIDKPGIQTLNLNEGLRERNCPFNCAGGHSAKR